MKTFDYVCAGTPGEAVAEAGKDIRFIAGGTNLLDLMKLEIETPVRLIDISRLELRAIEETETGGLRIGALVPNSDLAADVRVRERYPVLARALLAGASGQLRNMATTGGNLLQRTRCSYFYDTTMPCNKRMPGSGCSAIAGYNRMNAILGGSDQCIAVHPSDMAVAMLALDAVVHTQSGGGNTRSIRLEEFYRLPGDTPNIETVLAADELITHVELPSAPVGEQRYRKVRDRASYAFALVSVAAVIGIENGRISHAALAFGGLAPRPWRDRTIEAALIGQPPDRATFEEAADRLIANAHGYGANDFKIPLARNTLIGCLERLAGGGASV
jgi:xanthine dehydrogenase YagS FAD-binding subunit